MDMQACVGAFGTGLTWLLAGLAFAVSAIAQLVLALLLFVLNTVLFLLQIPSNCSWPSWLCSLARSGRSKCKSSENVTTNDL